jgi:hypothetical protein
MIQGHLTAEQDRQIVSDYERQETRIAEVERQRDEWKVLSVEMAQAATKEQAHAESAERRVAEVERERDEWKDLAEVSGFDLSLKRRSAELRRALGEYRIVLGKYMDLDPSNKMGAPDTELYKQATALYFGDVALSAGEGEK